MNKHIVFSSLLILMLGVSACGSAASAAMPTATPMSAVMPADTATMVPPAKPTSAAVVKVGQDSTLGSFLVDSAGMTLYLYTKDTPGTSNCFGACATKWPPLLTDGAPVAGDGVTASLLGTTTRPDGLVQVTYNGWPLYHFAKDMAAGDTTGEGVGSVWFVISPDGTQK
jgi:predicted lipoprotein with Yx(FWY)xxD motif